MRSILPVVALLSACSEYDLSGKGGNNHTEDPETDLPVDTGQDTDGDCPPEAPPGFDASINEECANEPEEGTFTPVIEWKMDRFTFVPNAYQVMTQPIVTSVNDDNGDGAVDDFDIPDIVVVMYDNSSWTNQGTVRAISGDGSREIWGVTIAGLEGMSGLSAADIDGDGLVEIAGAMTDGVVVLENDGSIKWQKHDSPGAGYGISDTVAISDMNGDGIAEIIYGSAIYSADGTKLGQGAYGRGGSPSNVGCGSFAVDIDRDGQQEVIAGNATYHMDGSVKWYNGGLDGYPAVGNFDSDDHAEIVLGGNGSIRLLDTDGTLIWERPVPGATSGGYGGPPTVADFDGDGEPEIGVASGSRYTVFEKDGLILWQANTQDASSGNTGSAVFDFEGDGAAEAVYADETSLWVYDGATGAVKLQSHDHSNGTWLEYPVIADVDGDDHAEIVVPNEEQNGGFRGITVFGDQDDSWTPGRRLWNQFAYHITNINDDHTIPTNPDLNWDLYNNFRSGDLQAGTGFDTVDLTLAEGDVCQAECGSGALTLWIHPGNTGAADLELISRGAIDVSYVSGGTEHPYSTTVITERLPIGEFQAGLPLEVSGLDWAEVEQIVVRIRSIEHDCDPRNNTLRIDGPFCE